MSGKMILLDLVYNNSMIKYHLVKNIYKGQTRYAIGFPRPKPQTGYDEITILRDGKGRTTDSREKARMLAERFIVDREKAEKSARIKAKKEAEEAERIKAEEEAKGENLETFLLGFWKMSSEYVVGKIAEGRSITEAYVLQSRNTVKRYFLPWARRNEITRIGQLTRLNLLQWRNELFLEIQKKGLAASRVNAARLALHVPLQWAFEMEKIQSNPLAAVHKVKEEPKERLPFERDELEKLFGIEWPNATAKLAFMLMAYTGLRVGEATGLTWDHVNLDEGRLDVVQQWQESLNKGLCKPKWGTVREDVTIPDDLIPALRRLRSSSPFPFSQFVFADKSPKLPILRAALSKALKDATKAAGIAEGRTAHSFRHGFATMMREEVGEERVSHELNHKSIETTKIYTSKATADDKAKIRKAVNALANGIAI